MLAFSTFDMTDWYKREHLYRWSLSQCLTLKTIMKWNMCTGVPFRKVCNHNVCHLKQERNKKCVKMFPFAMFDFADINEMEYLNRSYLSECLTLQKDTKWKISTGVPIRNV